MMHGLILAGGEGSRLAASGVTAPKAIVPVGGRPQIGRLVTTARRLGCDTITCAVRDDLAATVHDTLADLSVRIFAVRTPTSLHTLEAALRTVPNGRVFCTLVDTVMPEADWDVAHAQALALLDQGADAVVAVTPFVADESPLWVDVSGDGVVRAFGRQGTTPLVTGGVYWLSHRARGVATEAVSAGVNRLRGYLARLVDSGCRVETVVVPRIVDLDTDADLRLAAALVEGELS
jgi:NDP-sugar pyrophosphorylase family protein